MRHLYRHAVGCQQSSACPQRRAAPRICSALPTEGRKSCEAATSFPARIIWNFPPDSEPGMLEREGCSSWNIRAEPAAAAVTVAVLIKPTVQAGFSLGSRGWLINLYFQQLGKRPTHFAGCFLTQKELLYFQFPGFLRISSQSGQPLSYKTYMDCLAS